MSQDFPFQVGDEFVGSQIEINRFFGRVNSAGGKVELDGKILRIIYLPPKPIEEDIIAYRELVITPEAVIEETSAIIESVIEEPSTIEDLATIEEVVVEMKEEYIPKRRGRQAKNISTENK